MSLEPIHYQLHKAGINHICHYDLNSGFDLSRDATVCTECRIDRGEFTLADIVLGRVDPADEKAAWSAAVEAEREDRELRELGKLPKHAIYTVFSEKGGYMRYYCYLGRGSGPVEEDRKCFTCAGSVDE